MTIAAAEQPETRGFERFFDRGAMLPQALAVIAVGVVLALIFEWARDWPAAWTIPIKVWISDFFRWLDKTATLGLFTVKQMTRTIAWMLKQPLVWSPPPAPQS